MRLDLQHRRFDPRGGEQVGEQRHVEVADADVLDEALVHELLHGAPGLGDRHRVVDHDPVGGIGRVRVVHPLGGVPRLERDKLEGDWAHGVEVEVLEAEVVQGSEARVPHVFLTVVGVPQLARHPKVVAGDGRVLRQRALMPAPTSRSLP